MKLKTAHIIYYEYRSDRDEDYEIMDSNWDYCVEYFDDETAFATRLHALKVDGNTRGIEVYHGTVMKSYEESEK